MEILPILSTCIFLSYIVGIAIVILFLHSKIGLNIHNVYIYFLNGISSLIFLIAPLFIFCYFLCYGVS